MRKREFFHSRALLFLILGVAGGIVACKGGVRSRQTSAVESVLSLPQFPKSLLRDDDCFGSIPKFSQPSQIEHFHIHLILNSSHIAVVIFNIKYSSSNNVITWLSDPEKVYLRQVKRLEIENGEVLSIEYEPSKEVVFEDEKLRLLVASDWNFSPFIKDDPRPVAGLESLRADFTKTMVKLKMK